ncbi:hypothetical protein [Geoglobus acetivorans]|uniref:CRISPR-associated exonuclease Cas4 n=1 Tax=Geoglobus acetivorans TaxID=565033 RepID=A0ABZ3H4A7_GEOAI|nr:hypothetical protein [Geoglobus acetivorans]
MKYPASWVFRCPFQIYLAGKYPEYSRIEAEAIERGRKAEIEFERMLKSLRTPYRKQKPLNYRTKYYTIYGRADFITHSEVYEVKSVRAFRKPTKNWIGQLNLYLAMSGRKKGFLVEYNGEKFRKYEVNYSDRLFRESIEFFNYLHSGRYYRDTSYCQWCTYSFICEEL